MTTHSSNSMIAFLEFLHDSRDFRFECYDYDFCWSQNGVIAISRPFHTGPMQHVYIWQQMKFGSFALCYRERRG